MEQIKRDNDRKKSYLRQYQRTVRRLARIEEELAEVKAIRSGVPKDASGIRGSGGLNDLSSYAAELDRLEQELIRERYKRIRLGSGQSVGTGRVVLPVPERDVLVGDRRKDAFFRTSSIPNTRKGFISR